ncbi:MAG: hypothetical protein ACE5NM_02200 [Sedimentisphaerales bacterium]
MENQHETKERNNVLPACATEYIKLVVRKMRYRKKVRQDVKAELAAHFEDELKDCKTDEEKEQKARQLIADFGDVKLLAILMRRAKKRCRPLWKKALVRGFQVLAIFFLYLLICASPLIIGKPTISVNYVDWLNEFVRQGRDEIDNARPYYEKAVELYVEMPDWLIKSKAKWPTDFNDVQLQSLVSWLDDNQKSLETLRIAAQRPYYWSRYQKSGEGQLVETLMPDVMKSLAGYKNLARAMRWQIQLRAYNGDVDSALRDCAILLKFGNHLYGQGLLIEQLVGVAIEGLTHGEISTILKNTDVPADALRFVQDELAKQFKKQKPIISLEAEKVFWYDLIQRGFTDDGQGDGRLLKQGLPYVVQDSKDFFGRLLTFRYPSRQEFAAKIDEYFEQVDKLFEVTPWDLHNKEKDTEKWNRTLEQSSLMLKIQGPAHERVSQIGWRMKTGREALLTVLAIMRYEKDKGRYPENLAELVSSGYLDRLPMDPFGGQPFSYSKTEDGFILYSLGMDFEDDGGRLGLDSRGKPRMWADTGDWVFWPVLEAQVKQ